MATAQFQLRAQQVADGKKLKQQQQAATVKTTYGDQEKRNITFVTPTFFDDWRSEFFENHYPTKNH